MKRIGVLTLNDYFNYGNRLQNVALVYFLRQLNKNNFINSLWYNDQKNRISKRYVNFTNIRRYVLNRRGFKDYINKGLLFNDIIREYNIKNLVINIHMKKRFFQLQVI